MPIVPAKFLCVSVPWVWKGEIVFEVAVGGLASTVKLACSGTVSVTEPLRFSMVTLPSGGALVTSTEPLRLVTETSPGDAIERDVAAARGERKRADGFAGGEVGVVADVDLAVETAELDVGAAGVELDGAADVFEVGGSEELAIHGDRAAEVGEGEVVAAAFDGERAR